MDSESPKTAGRFLAAGPLKGEEIELSPAEATHAVKSRRLAEGSRVEVMNGEGLSRAGLIRKGKGKSVLVHFTEPVRTHPRAGHRLTVAVSPPKGDRMNFLVEKLSELGVDRLMPTVFRRSLDAGVRATTAKTTRWKRTAAESAKQCGRYFLLELTEPMTLEAVSQGLKNYDLTAVFSLEDAGDTPEHFNEILRNRSRPPEETLLLVGPEGGLTSTEEGILRTGGTKAVSLGPRILRIETAALAAAALFRATWD